MRSRQPPEPGGRTRPAWIRSVAIRPGKPLRRLAGQQGVEQREPQRRLDRRGAEVALDAFEDRLQADQLARRVQVEQAVDERLGALDDREPIPEPAAGDVGALGGRLGPLEIVLVERRGALLAAAALAAADRAAVVLSGRRRGRSSRRPRSASACTGPDELVGDEHPLARRAAGREQVADRVLQARLAAGRRAHRLERRVEVAEVRRAQDELGEEPGQRARLDADRAALAVDRGVGDPAAAAVQVEHDVARPRVRLEPRRDEARRRRRGEAIEEREREAGLGSNEGRATRHRDKVPCTP